MTTRYRDRYIVPDLSPHDRAPLAKVKPRLVFIAESPHKNEIEPEALPERRPLCGAAGKQWWSALGEIVEKQPDSDVSLPRLLKFCAKHRIAVMNAVQFPLDPKITLTYPGADPVKNLGFAKVAGERSYKKMKNSPQVVEQIASLRERLEDRALKDVPIYCLGNDAEWFVQQALGKEEFARRVQGRIPHPSAWWRRQGLFGRIAREKLSEIFKSDGGR